MGYSRTSGYNSTCNITCPSNCLNCDGLGQCTKCNTGYYIYNYTCVRNCPALYMSDSVQCIKCDSNCVVCQPDGKCITCISGLSVTPAGICISNNCTVS